MQIYFLLSSKHNKLVSRRDSGHAIGVGFESAIIGKESPSKEEVELRFPCNGFLLRLIFFYLDGEPTSFVVSWGFAPSGADGFYAALRQLLAILRKVDFHPPLRKCRVTPAEHLRKAHKRLHHTFHLVGHVTMSIGILRGI